MFWVGGGVGRPGDLDAGGGDEGLGLARLGVGDAARDEEGGYCRG